VGSHHHAAAVGFAPEGREKKSIETWNPKQYPKNK
jgi:hypothetical protein